MHSVEKSELVELKFANSELQTKLEWKHSKEFRFEGEMYDIVHKTEHADSTIFYCWWDHEETKLYKKLDQLLATALGANPTRQQQSKLALHFFKTLYFNDLSNNTWVLTSTANKYSLLSTNPVKVYSLPTTPPPQTV